MTGRVEPTLMADQVYGVLRDAIMSGELPGGARLRVRDVAAQVGTSVMPVREAIRRLEEAGLAERVPHKGAVVKSVSVEELVDIYDVRRLLEVEAARLGVASISADDCDRMQVEFESMRAAIDQRHVVGHIDRDEALLAILYRAAGNRVLVDTIAGLWSHCRLYKIMGAHAALEQAADGDALWRYQAELIDAARRRDVETAASITAMSITAVTDRLRAALEAESGVHAD
ncbi:GntR family transcriptional regulator [Gordonia sp. TBRC 11910]|uniref:GntR family transcriptional regulator n=1 Tax=Gordonia asplenii TaxID=2725283 RepID=A0A848KRY8_9ACTN|nr:GntR family transcriptional regulator [Gordonia asplenii]NMO01724.1 GntR family transcriptional regulator [Gordonia asplenii]